MATVAASSRTARGRMRLTVAAKALAAAALATAALTGCGQRPVAEEMVLPPTSELTTGQQWGVVRSEFLRLRADATLRGEVLAYLRRGEIIEVMGRGDSPREIEGESEYWYQVSYEGVRGWAFGAYIGVAESRSAAAALLDIGGNGD